MNKIPTFLNNKKVKKNQYPDYQQINKVQNFGDFRSHGKNFSNEAILRGWRFDKK